MENIKNSKISELGDVDVIIREAEELVKTNPHNSLALSVQAIEAAKAVSDNKSLAKANLNAGIASRKLSKFDASFVYYDNALKLYIELKDGPGEIKALNCLANLYYSLSDYENAIENYKKCLELLEKHPDPDFKAHVLSNMGLAYQEFGNLDESLINYFKSLNIFQELNKQAPHSLLNNIGISYQDLGDYKTALEYFYKALKIEEEAHNLQDKSFTLGNIGMCYNHLEDHTNAVIYLSEAMIILKQLIHRQGEANIFVNLAFAYSRLKCYPQALAFYFRALKYFTEISDRSSVASTLNALGTVYFNLNDYVNAKKYFQDSVEMSVKIGDEVNETKNYTGIAKLYLKFSDMQSAKNFLNKALKLSKKRNAVKELSMIHMLYSNGFRQLGDLKMAGEHLEKHHQYELSCVEMQSQIKLKDLADKLKLLSSKNGVSSSRFQTNGTTRYAGAIA